MTIDEYKAEYPQDAVFIQVDDTERLMTDEEYEAWVEQCLQHQPPTPMKTLAIVAALAIALMFVVTSCSDRIRGECITKPEAPRCDTSTGATTP
jgi:hypothetical protein